MTTHAYRELFNQVQHLTREDQFQLLEDLVALLHRQSLEEPLHNIMEFKGIAKELWRDVDVQKYIDQERDSWDG